MLALGALAQLGIILRYGVEVPMWDEWLLVPYMDPGHHLSLFAQHNEHRIAVTRMVLLGLAHLTSWQIRIEMVLGWVILQGTVLALYCGMRSHNRGRESLWYVLALVPLFSLYLYENLLEGFGVGFHLVVACIVWSTLSLSQRLSWPRFSLSIALGWIASFSLLNGLLAWVSLYPLLHEHTRLSSDLGGDRLPSYKGVAFRLLWFASAGLATAIYAYGYVRPAQHPPLTWPWSAGFFPYWLHFLGSALWHSALGATLAGGFLCLLLLGGLAARIFTWSRDAVWLTLIGFALISGAMIGTGRAGWYAVSSRYAEFAALLPIGLMAMLLGPMPRGRESVRRVLAALFVLLLPVSYINSWRVGLGAARGWNTSLEANRACLYCYEVASDVCLGRLFFDLDLLRRWAHFLREHRLSLFASPQPCLLQPGAEQVPGGGLTPSSPAAVLKGTTLHLFVRGADSRLYLNSRSGNTWSGWSEVPGGGLTPNQPAAVLDSSGALRLYVQGINNRLYVNSRSGGTWSGWSEVPGGGQTPSGPEAVLDGGLVRLVVRGVDDRIYTTLAAIPPYTEVPGGGQTPSSPAAVLEGSTLHLFVRGADSRLYLNSRSGGAWSGWSEVPGGGLTLNQPAAVLDSSSVVRLFVQGINNNRLYVNSQTGGSWNGWSEVPGGGQTPSGPAAVLDGGLVRLVVRGMDNRLYTIAP